MSHRVVFLDFDGVLNSHAYARTLPPERQGGLLGLDPAAVLFLNALLREGRADVVVSSAWRILRSRCELVDVLRAAGFEGRVLGTTQLVARREASLTGDPFHRVTRGEEVDDWIRKNASRFPLESFVILDDDGDLDPHLDRHVRTRFLDGLQRCHVDLALAHLARPLPKR